MMRSQFAMAVRADEKWVENAARLLNKRFKYSASEARWLGLVRVLNREIGLTLSHAAEVADEALRHAPDEGRVLVGGTESGTAALSIDMPRFYSAYAAALSAALDLGGGRRRGRPRGAKKRKSPALARAAEYGVDIGLLREGLHLSPGKRLQQLDDNAAFIRAIGPAGKASRPSVRQRP